MILIPRIPLRTALGLLIAGTFLANSAAAQDPPDTTTWHTTEELDDQLRRQIGFLWEGTPLDSVLERLARAQQVAIFLDRRIDPSQEISLEIEQATFQECLGGIAHRLEAGWCRVGPVIYIGPVETSNVLATLVAQRTEEIETMPAAISADLRRLQPSSWENLSEPSQLIQAIVAEQRWQIVGMEELPYDLWAGSQLPQMNFIERLTILLAGFQRTFHFDIANRTIRLVELPETVQLTRRYSGRGQPANLARRLQDIFDDLAIVIEGDSIVIEGRWEDHHQIEQVLAGQSIRRPDSDTEQRYTLRVTNQPAEGLLRTLASRIGLEIRFEETTDEQRAAMVTFDVQEVTLEELFTAAATPAGLAVTLEDELLTVRPLP